jgi:hypothetical protein
MPTYQIRQFVGAPPKQVEYAPPPLAGALNKVLPTAHPDLVRMVNSVKSYEQRLARGELHQGQLNSLNLLRQYLADEGFVNRVALSGRDSYDVHRYIDERNLPAAGAPWSGYNFHIDPSQGIAGFMHPIDRQAFQKIRALVARIRNNEPRPEEMELARQVLPFIKSASKDQPVPTRAFRAAW